MDFEVWGVAILGDLCGSKNSHDFLFYLALNAWYPWFFDPALCESLLVIEEYSLWRFEILGMLKVVSEREAQNFRNLNNMLVHFHFCDKSWITRIRTYICDWWAYELCRILKFIIFGIYWVIVSLFGCRQDAANEIAAELQSVPDLIIGNYSDGNLVASLLSYKLGITQVCCDFRLHYSWMATKEINLLTGSF